jgi:hypothetical protein
LGRQGLRLTSAQKCFQRRGITGRYGISEFPIYHSTIGNQDTLIRKEERYYEYYNRFIEIGNILKEKYGDKMIDLVPDEYGACL